MREIRWFFMKCPGVALSLLFEGSSVNEGKSDRMLSRIETFLCPNVMRAKYVEICGYNVIIELLINL